VRDPEGWVEDDGQQIIRHAYHPLPESHFLRTPSAQALVEKGILTPFSIQSPSRIAADRIDFPTYPREWVPSQLFEAARTTLEVLESAVAAGYEIKDASARNILFRSKKNGGPTGSSFAISFSPLRRTDTGELALQTHIRRTSTALNQT